MINSEERLPFMRFRGIAGIISALLVIASIVSLSVNKLNFGLDFTGGTLLEVGFEEPADLNRVRSSLESEGFGDAVVQLDRQIEIGKGVFIVVQRDIRKAAAIIGLGRRR